MDRRFSIRRRGERNSYRFKTVGKSVYRKVCRFEFDLGHKTHIMEHKQERQKIWSITGGSEVTKVMDLMIKYSDGLNSSQDVIKSNVEVSMETNGDPVFSILANGHLIASVRVVLNYSYSGFCMVLKLNHFKKREQNCFSFESLENTMDDAIAGDEMGSYVAHLMAVKSRFSARPGDRRTKINPSL